jgi:hypothetical protein
VNYFSFLCLNIDNHISASIDNHQSTFQEQRLSKRLGDKDLRHHVGRLYLEGVNSPFHWLGGSWELPSSPPAHLQGLFVPEEEGGDITADDVDVEKGRDGKGHTNTRSRTKSDAKLANSMKWSRYSYFAKMVNEAVQWDMGGWEVVYYFFLLLAAPPRAEKFLVSVRSVTQCRVSVSCLFFISASVTYLHVLICVLFDVISYNEDMYEPLNS